MSSSRQGGGVDVILESCDFDQQNVPHCPHGPTLLFERFSAGGISSGRFYACSACRDRRDCNFFQWEDAKAGSSKGVAREHDINFSHQQLLCRLKVFRQLRLKDRKLCKDCGMLLLPDDWLAHNGHDLLERVTRRQLRRPSKLLPPIENKKTNAQYLFSDAAVEFTLRCIEELGYRKVLCLGTPRIHEEIVCQQKLDSSYPVRSLLLDMDHRYEQFYSCKTVCHYNMFNHYFFRGAVAQAAYKKFLSNSNSDEIILVTDPPFGGLVEVIAHTIRKIMTDWSHDTAVGRELPVFWFFPYFLERWIVEGLPSLRMLHYKVDYDNHVLYQKGSRGAKHGSPVRLFTNLPPASIKLPLEEGYRFCAMCQCYVPADIQHCDRCGACTSKDGRQYTHCDKCQRCVKPSHVHCDQCNQCHLMDYKCGDTKTTGCHICGDLGHKRRDCPNKKRSQNQETI
ncbi:rRNA N6-adenosine-methyltransferase ZCCHC4 [Lamellibrachia satsuma]|nr:rRNA N6-adenosine-methyltransferase ZCCHC4 [Lamellibrachia satsuma]